MNIENILPTLLILKVLISESDYSLILTDGTVNKCLIIIYVIQVKTTDIYRPFSKTPDLAVAIFQSPSVEELQ